jgi:DNA-directed RNA polymerase specialized sigma24 family protein
MVAAVNDYDGSQKFEANEGPLCMWGEDDGEQSDFYGVCSQCTWGVPANNKETFIQMVEEGYSDYEIADDLGTSTDAVNYWKYKFNL